MLLSAEDLKSPNVATKVCVIGSGAAGIILAKVLAEANIDVVLIDGHVQPTASCPSDRTIPQGYSPAYEGPQGDFLNCTAAVVPSPGEGRTWMTTTRKQTLGGSTNCWGSTCIPLQD